MSCSGAQWLDRSSFMLLLRCFLYTIFFLDFPKANHMQLSIANHIQFASELKGVELKSPVNLPSKMLIDGELMAPYLILYLAE